MLVKHWSVTFCQDSMSFGTDHLLNGGTVTPFLGGISTKDGLNCFPGTPPKTNKSHLKMDGWNTIVSFLGPGLFSGAMLVSGRVMYWANLREGFAKRITSGILDITWVGPPSQVASHRQDDFTVFRFGDSLAYQEGGLTPQDMKDEKVVSAMGTNILTKVCSYQMSPKVSGPKNAGGEPDFRLFLVVGKLPLCRPLPILLYVGEDSSIFGT